MVKIKTVRHRTDKGPHMPKARKWVAAIASCHCGHSSYHYLYFLQPFNSGHLGDDALWTRSKGRYGSCVGDR